VRKRVTVGLGDDGALSAETASKLAGTIVQAFADELAKDKGAK
jgi:predicted HTH domain antitoxin